MTHEKIQFNELHSEDPLWTAFLYVSDELSESDAIRFEERLAEVPEFQEALISATRLSLNVAGALSSNTTEAASLGLSSDQPAQPRTQSVPRSRSVTGKSSEARQQLRLPTENDAESLDDFRYDRGSEQPATHRPATDAGSRFGMTLIITTAAMLVFAVIAIQNVIHSDDGRPSSSTAPIVVTDAEERADEVATSDDLLLAAWVSFENVDLDDDSEELGLASDLMVPDWMLTAASMEESGESSPGEPLNPSGSRSEKI